MDGGEKYPERKKQTFLFFLPHFKIPLFTLRCVYKYSPRKKEMTCLCNVPSDLASDGIAELKTTEKEKKEKGGEKKHTKKSTGDISDKRKQMLLKRVDSRGAVGQSWIDKVPPP